MADDSPPLVPRTLSNDKKSSSWNFDDLHNENEDENSDDFFSVLKKNISKHVYLDEERNSKKTLSNQLNQRSTIRIDSSDLISRCRNFLPLLTDANQNLFTRIKSGENVRIELDEDDDNERTIEMNIMFCPNMDPSSSSESDDDDDDKQIKSPSLQINKKINQVNIVEIQSTNKLEENVNN